jgi:hypothetical protein
LKKIDGVKAPNTNLSIVQTSIFLKFKDLFWFLMDRFIEVAAEVTTNYVAIIRQYYSSSFDKYLRMILKFHVCFEKGFIVRIIWLKRRI